MADDLNRLSDLTHSGEELLKNLLRARDNAEIDTLMECVQRWREELIALGEAIDPIRLRFRMVRPTLEETARIWPLYPELRADQRGHCNYVEAALGRVHAYLRQHTALPKGKGGNRRRFHDRRIIEKAHAIKKTKGIKSNTAAAREAIKRYPSLVEDGASPESTLKRITRQM